MILFLDDEKWRHDLMEKHYPGNVRHVYNCVQLFKALREPFQKFDQIWLDHDLGQFDDKDPVQGDGMVAAEMVVSAFKQGLIPEVHRIRIHSFNEPASKRMEEFLDKHVLDDGRGMAIVVARQPFSIEFPGVIQVDQALQSSHHGQSNSGTGGTAGVGDHSAGGRSGEAPGSPGAGDQVQVRSGEGGGGGASGPADPVEGE